MHSNALLNLLLLSTRSQIQHTCLLARVAEAVVQHSDQQRLRSLVRSGCGWDTLENFRFQSGARNSLRTFRFQCSGALESYHRLQNDSKEQERALKLLRASACQR